VDDASWHQSLNDVAKRVPVQEINIIAFDPGRQSPVFAVGPLQTQNGGVGFLG
jgi:hypothetical protein